MSTLDRSGRFLPLAIVGTAATLFLLFVYGYPRLFPLVDEAFPLNFDQAVANALDAGNTDKALFIARRATELPRFGGDGNRIDPGPMDYTTYARVLLATGRNDEALVQLNKAVGLLKENTYPYRQTRLPFYFAPARNTLGKHFVEQGDIRGAVANFELARAYPATADADTEDFRPALYEAYAELGLWARALEFGEPSDPELDALGTPSLLQLAHICDGAENWALGGRVAERLSSREGGAPEAHYLLGRAALEQDQYRDAVTQLRQAAGVHPVAAFLYGMALFKSGLSQEAFDTCLNTPSTDLYRPFALYNALAILHIHPDQSHVSTAVTRDELLTQLDGAINAMRQTGRAIQYDKYSRFVPVAVSVSEPHFRAGGRFPVLILWEDKQPPPADPGDARLSVSDTDDSTLFLRRGNNLLQLQWVDNRVNWDVVEHLEPGPGDVPGWTDTAHDWFGLRSGYVTQIQRQNGGNASLDLTALTWCYSVPVPVRDTAAYLLVGRCKGPQGKASLGWQAIDKTERVLSGKTLHGTQQADGWEWQAAYMRAQFQWDALRVSLNTAPSAGIVSFNDIMLIAIEEPSLALSD